MKVKNTEHIAGGRPTQIKNCKGLSDVVIIEIVHGIKEIIIKLIDQKYQPVLITMEGKVKNDRQINQ